MIEKKYLIKRSEVLWEIPKSFRHDMRVPALVFATEEMLDQTISDRSLEQLINVATLPNIQKYALVMPDVHEGYGFPIGGIAATSYPEGVISPGGIGYDINCGVRLLISNLSKDEVHPYLGKLAQELYKQIPSGVGREGKLRLTYHELDKVLEEGVNWLLQKGYADKEDIQNIESYGKLTEADRNHVSDHAKGRGKNQLGTMGAGNHFIEVEYVDQIYNEQIAHKFGLSANQITVLIHTGSRGLGHQVATDYIRRMLNSLKEYKITLSDRELACAPFSSNEGKQYFAAMSAAANFAWANRQMITYEVRETWKEVFGEKNGRLSLLYDVAHNIAKLEDYEIGGKKQKVVVHRKGATRAFGPQESELTDKYKNTGQPVIIPGSMGTASFVLVGTDEAKNISFSSTCHGAGRRMSRSQAKREISGQKLLSDLKNMGITVETRSVYNLAEEAPLAYKDVDSVVDVVEIAGIAKKIARLKPLVVIKG